MQSLENLIFFILSTFRQKLSFQALNESYELTFKSNLRQPMFSLEYSTKSILQ